MDDRIGLVFAGGGGKGSYEIGAWKALRSLGIDKKIKGVSGNSIGALNSLFIMSNQYDEANSIWRNVRQKDVIPVTLATLIKLYPKCKLELEEKLKEESILTMDGIDNILRKNLDYDRVKKSEIVGYVSAYNLDDRKMEYFKINDRESEDIVQFTKASAALPLVFDPVIINGKEYRDGCIGDNVPVEPLYKEGFRTIIVIHLNNTEPVAKYKYEGAKIFEIVPRVSLGGLIDGTLDFNKEGSKRRFQQGYFDTMSYFDQFNIDYVPMKKYKMCITKK